MDLAGVARTILASNLYMTLGTVDEDGRPWVAPVYYATSEYRELYWVSSPDAVHSRNVAVNPRVSIVVFDSQAPVGSGQAVYMAADAEQLTDGELEAGIEVFSAHSQAHGARPWTTADVSAPAPHRLYRATVSEHWVLDPDARPDQRTPVEL
jgi:nitroimidazol reductase NimA-like FMN-containing flavoprotein (pyridoxamine 5'-phosphate oxidase superfamily)